MRNHRQILRITKLKIKLTDLDRKIIHAARIERRRLLNLINEVSAKAIAKHIGVSEGCVHNFNSRKKSRRFLNTIEGKL